MEQRKINYSSLPTKETPRENGEDGRVETVETSAGSFSIFYGVHGGFSRDEPLSAKHMEGVDALILEGMGISPKMGDPRYAASSVRGEQRGIGRNIVNSAMEKGTPIFLVDVSADFSEIHKNDEWKIKLVSALEALLGASITVVGSKYLSQPITRREFLKRSAILTISGYFFLPIIKEGTSSMASKSRSMRKMDKLIDSAHPETNSVVVEGRNCLFAQKSETVAKLLEEQIGHKPKVAISIGTAHYGLEDELQTKEEERINKLKAYKDMDLDKESLIVRIDFEKAEDLGKDKYRVKVTLLHDQKMQNH